MTDEFSQTWARSPITAKYRDNTGEETWLKMAVLLNLRLQYAIMFYDPHVPQPKLQYKSHHALHKPLLPKTAGGAKKLAVDSFKSWDRCSSSEKLGRGVT